MSRYLRFPEATSFHKTFWEYPPKNPTCGLISYETGAKIYAWVYLIFSAINAILSGLLLFLVAIMKLREGGSHNALVKRVRIEGDNMEDVSLEDLDNYFRNHHIAGKLYATLFIGFIISTIVWYFSRKLKIAIVDKDVIMLKKMFVFVAFIQLMLLIFNLIETETVWTLAFIPVLIGVCFEIMGLMFIYGFVAGLVEQNGHGNNDPDRFRLDV